MNRFLEWFHVLRRIYGIFFIHLLLCTMVNIDFWIVHLVKLFLLLELLKNVHASCFVKVGFGSYVVVINLGTFALNVNWWRNGCDFGFNGWLLEDLNGMEGGGKSAIDIVWSVGFNEGLKRKGDEVWTAETEKFWSSSLERTTIRLSEPFTEPLLLELTSSFARAFLFWSSSLERTQPSLSEPLTEPWSLEPPPFFARPCLIWSSPLKRTHIRSSEPLPESGSLEPFSLFARPFLTCTCSLEGTYICSSEPLPECCSLERIF